MQSRLCLRVTARGDSSVTQLSPKRSRINLFYVTGFSFQCKVNPKYLKSSSSVADGVMATKDMLTLAYVDLMQNTMLSDGVKPVGSKAWFIRNGIRLVNHLNALHTSFMGSNHRIVGWDEHWLPSSLNRRVRRLTDHYHVMAKQKLFLSLHRIHCKVRSAKSKSSKYLRIQNGHRVI